MKATSNFFKLINKKYLNTVGKKQNNLELRPYTFAKYTSNFMRQALLQIFADQMKVFENKNTLRTALIGGSRKEPEIQFLQDSGKDLELTLFGIEIYDIYLDLNTSNPEQIEGNFDLIICSQVFEHIWNHENFFKIIEKLSQPNGFIWITCPASNRFHGSPSYYSAGFNDQYFSENFNLLQIKTIASGTIGTKRNYFATHILPVWLTYKGHKAPILYAFAEKKLTVRILFTVRYFFRNIFLTFQSGKLHLSSHIATETWIFAKSKFHM